MAVAARIVAAALLAALALASGVVLARTLLASDPPRRPVLARTIDGGPMEQYLETREEKDVLLEWIERGAPREGWERVRRVLEERCVSCHNPYALETIVPLEDYGIVARLAAVRPLLAEKIEGGTMEKYLEGAGEKEALLAWIDEGAARERWETVAPILAARCVHCHNPETGVPGLVALDRYAPVARIATLPPPPRPPWWRIAAPGGLFLGAVVGLARLRRRRS